LAQVVVGGPEDAGSFSACADATEGKTVEKSRKNTKNIEKYGENTCFFIKKSITKKRKSDNSFTGIRRRK